MVAHDFSKIEWYFGVACPMLALMGLLTSSPHLMTTPCGENLLRYVMPSNGSCLFLYLQ